VGLESDLLVHVLLEPPLLEDACSDHEPLILVSLVGILREYSLTEHVEVHLDEGFGLHHGTIPAKI